MFNFFKNSQKKKYAFMAGRKARTMGENYNTNPYLPGTNEHGWWDGGWYAVDNRLKQTKVKNGI